MSSLGSRTASSINRPIDVARLAASKASYRTIPKRNTKEPCPAMFPPSAHLWKRIANASYVRCSSRLCEQPLHRRRFTSPKIRISKILVQIGSLQCSLAESCAMAHLYDKQVRWQQINQLKVAAFCFCVFSRFRLSKRCGGCCWVQQAEVERKKEALEEEKQHTFSPRIYSKPLKEFDGSARRLTENFTERHVQRQMKARQQKEQEAQRCVTRKTALNV